MIEKDLGLIDFEEFLKIQDGIWVKRVRDEIPNILIFAEHPVVFSLGARPTKDQLRHLRTWPEILAELGIKIVETKRGGNVTLHAPGILGIYPIFGVLEPFAGPKIVDWLEEITAAVLSDYDIAACRNANVNRGLWVAGRKIASVGVSVARLVSRFGINLNISPRLHLFDHVNPCGIPGCRMTSMEEELNYLPSMDDVKQAVWRHVLASPRI